jgi:hypothetical protein
MNRPVNKCTVKRSVVVLVAVGTLAALPASVSPAQAVVRAADFSGFTTQATATPLKIEVYEPAIPVPADPQMEMDWSYTRVDGASGPIGTARASALWPGDSVGEGWKTIGEQIGLPDAFTKDGYPEQVNAQSPGDTTEASQEPFPGMVTRVNASDTKATAKVGYGSSGEVQEGQVSGEPEGGATNPLTALSQGDLSALGSAITGSANGTAGAPPTSSPLGALSAVVDANGMQSVSTTDYSGAAVVAKSTSRLGQISLVGGLVKLTGVEVVARTTSNLAAGAKNTYQVHIGGMSIAGQSYSMTPDGIVGGGKTTPIPGLPSDPTAALKALGISLEMPKPQLTREGASGSVAVRGLQVTIDSGPLKSKLPALPLGDLINKMPEQAGQLKSLLLALAEAHPKFVITLGANTATAATVAGIGAEGSAPPATGTGTTGSSAGTGAPASVGAPGEVAPTATTPASTTPVQQVSAVPGLPPLGSVPGALTVLGLLLAAGAGWYLRRMGGLLFGTAASCTHGLKAGVPDLRRA